MALPSKFVPLPRDLHSNLCYTSAERVERTAHSRLHWHLERDHVHLLLLRQVGTLDRDDAAFDFRALFRAARGLPRVTDCGLPALEHQLDRGIFHQHVQHGHDTYLCHVAALYA